MPLVCPQVNATDAQPRPPLKQHVHVFSSLSWSISGRGSFYSLVLVIISSMRSEIRKAARCEIHWGEFWNGWFHLIDSEACRLYIIVPPASTFHLSKNSLELWFRFVGWSWERLWNYQCTAHVALIWNCKCFVFAFLPEAEIWVLSNTFRCWHYCCQLLNYCHSFATVEIWD
jgi:hypothetical protein